MTDYTDLAEKGLYIPPNRIDLGRAPNYETPRRSMLLVAPSCLSLEEVVYVKWTEELHVLG